MTFDQLLPVFLSTMPPEKSVPTRLPFKFVGGFGFDNQTIGVIISAQGVYSMLVSFVIFPWASRRVGNLRLFQLVAAVCPLLLLATPYLVLLPEVPRMASIYFIVGWKATIANIGFPTNNILIRNSSPSMLWMGTINGVAASTASLCRTFAPTLSGLLYATGLGTGYMGLPWWFSSLISIAGFFIALQLRETLDPFDEKADDVEAGLLPPPPSSAGEEV